MAGAICTKNNKNVSVPTPGLHECQPLSFKGTEGVVGLSQWLEKIESVFHISGCAIDNQVKFATYTLLEDVDGQNNISRRNSRNGESNMDLKLKGNDVGGSGEKKPYGGSKPLCRKCNYHHDGECAPKCTNCKKVGHLTKDCWHPINANNQRTITGYECGNQGHYRSDCPKLKNRNHGNQAGGTEAHGMVYALGGGETDQDINNMEYDINA
ncbi:reverse transcriptase domain-containing protein [Tanacetum coccineum]